MNVLVVASWYPSESNRVSGVFVKEQVAALRKAGVNVVVLYPYDKALKPRELMTLEEDGVLTYRANTDYMKNSKLSRIRSIYLSVKIIDKLVKKHNIELLHAHVCYSAGFAAAFYHRGHGLTYIITEHMSYITNHPTFKAIAHAFHFFFKEGAHWNYQSGILIGKFK